MLPDFFATLYRGKPTDCANYFDFLIYEESLMKD